MDPYYVCTELPEPFRAADLLMAQEYPQPKVVRKPKVVPVPSITVNHGAQGPIQVTEDWYMAEKAKQERKRAKAKKEAEFEMIQLIARQDMLRGKLGEQDPTKAKGARKIAAINIELRNIEELISELEEQYDIHPTELDHGTRIGRFLGKVKHKAKKFCKKVKKFYKHNIELITGIATIVLPVIGSVILKALLKS